MTTEGRIADLVKVDNTERKFGAANEYFAIRVQLPDGTETTLLFTENELAVAQSRANRNTEDIPVADTLLSKLRNWVD